MINLNPVIEGLCRLSMSFANEKMRERTKFYSKDRDVSFLHESLGKEVLPEEYGGTNGTMRHHIGNDSPKVAYIVKYLVICIFYHFKIILNVYWLFRQFEARDGR